MGTIESYETPSLAAALRSQRTTTQHDVDEYADAHGTQVRYNDTNTRHVPSAH